MASFFRWRIANKVIPLLLKNGSSDCQLQANTISSIVKVRRSQGEPQLFISWKRVTDSLHIDDATSPTALVTQLRNQGLPTAEGFTDITLNQEPLGLTFTVDKHVFSKIILTDICSGEGNSIKDSCLFKDISKKSILLQCHTPSVGDVFHMEHFRAAIHCNFLANINTLVGHKVKKLWHITDGGLKSAILLTGYKEFGNEEELLKDSSIHLSELLKAGLNQYNNDLKFKQKVDTCLKKLESGDDSENVKWKFLCSELLKQHTIVFDKIGLAFDDTYSDSANSAEIDIIHQTLHERNIISIQEDGVLKFNIPIPQDEKNCTKYDVDQFLFKICGAVHSCIKNKGNDNFDAMLYVAPVSNCNIVSLLPPLLKALGFDWHECLQHVRLQDITQYQKNKKNFILQNILKQAKTNFLNKFKQDLNLYIDQDLESMAEVMGLTSLVVHDMKNQRKVDYRFDWKEVLSLGKDSGPLLQFCHAGLKGIQDDAEHYFKLDIDTSPLLEKEAHALIQHLARFDEIVYKSYILMEPCIILQYLFSLWYFTDRATNILKLDIKSDRLIVLKARLMLLSATTKVLHQGLQLLGLTPFETNYTRSDFVKT